MIAKSNSPEGWKTIASAISTLVEEATFTVSSEEITFRSMDPSHIALIDIKWPNSAFEQYHCDEEIRFGIRINELLKLLKRANKNDIIEVSISNNTFTLHIYNSYSKKYTLNLIDATSSTTPLPKLSFNTKIRLTMEAFREMLDDVGVVTDYITIDANKDRVIFAGKGDTGDVSIVLKEGNEKLTSLEVKEDSKATYSLEYLSGITKAIGTNVDDLTIEFSTSMPIKIEFKTQMAKINYYLAPRVES